MEHLESCQSSSHPGVIVLYDSTAARESVFLHWRAGRCPLCTTINDLAGMRSTADHLREVAGMLDKTPGVAPPAAAG